MHKENGNKKNKINEKEFIVSAGEMNLVGGKVKPNPAKGQMRFYVNRDNILCLEWINLETSTSNEPLLIFEDEWEWKKIETAKGRVYVLQNKTFPDTQNFFWLQYPNKAEDSLNESIIKRVLKTGKLQLDENEQENDIEMTIENIVKKEESLANAENKNLEIEKNNQSNNSVKNSDFIKNFTSALRNLETSNY
jgi:hypothetical protein